MSLVSFATDFVERRKLPDSVTAAGIAFLVGRTARSLGRGKGRSDADFARIMARGPIAHRPDAANRQHYEVPAEFFGLVLGPRRKYSCCLYADAASTLSEAEVLALESTAAHADLRDGQAILELGCGWGSLTLWMAEHYPAARITAVSNSNSQREYIQAQAQARGFGNLRVITADMNDFNIGQSFDRVVSVEMFEHMTNWQILLERVRGWLRQDGRAFIHVFSHRSTPYIFDIADKQDWIAQHFFTGGIMPSHTLIRLVTDELEVEEEWRWSGTHYARTAMDWLAAFDRHEARITEVLTPVYGADTALWKRRWRLFFLATAGLFGHAGGTEWGVSHYRLRPA